MPQGGKNVKEQDPNPLLVGTQMLGHLGKLYGAFLKGKHMIHQSYF